MEKREKKDNSISRLIQKISLELEKKENASKIECVKQGMYVYLLRVIHPYIITIVTIMILILILQGCLIAKLMTVSFEIKSAILLLS